MLAYHDEGFMNFYMTNQVACRDLEYNFIWNDQVEEEVWFGDRCVKVTLPKVRMHKFLCEHQSKRKCGFGCKIECMYAADQVFESSLTCGC